jgi:hypothetical protein
MSAVVDRFVNIDIAIANFQIETAVRISADPGFVLNSSTLTTEIGKRYQIASFAFLTLGEIVVLFQKTHLPSRLINQQYTTKGVS